MHHASCLMITVILLKELKNTRVLAQWASYTYWYNRCKSCICSILPFCALSKVNFATPSMTLPSSTRNVADSGTGNATVVIYNVLEIFGIASISFTLFTAWFSSTVKRSPAWFLLISSALLFGVSGLLIIGKQTNIQPSRALCCAQAIVVYPATMLSVFLSYPYKWLWELTDLVCLCRAFFSLYR